MPAPAPWARETALASLQTLLTRLLLRLPDALLLRMAGGSPTVTAGRTLDPALQLIAANAAKQGGTYGSPDEVRGAMNAGLAILTGAPRRLASVEQLTLPGAGANISARLYRPRALPDPAPLLIFFHQGGFVIGTLDWCEAFCSMLADEAGCLVLSVDYRLAPEHHFPTAVLDGLAAWRWVQEQAGELGGDPSRVAVGGDSAGGNLAAVVSQELRGAGGNEPLLQLLIYPGLEGRARVPSRQTYADAWPLDARLMDWFMEYAVSTPDDLDHAWLNPLHAKDLAGLPPALIFTAGFDVLCDEGAEYAQKLSAAGVPTTYRCFDALAHSFTAMGAVPSCQQAQLEIARTLSQALA